MQLEILLPTARFQMFSNFLYHCVNYVEALLWEREDQPLIYFNEFSKVNVILTFLKMLKCCTYALELLGYSYCDLRQEFVANEISGKT